MSFYGLFLVKSVPFIDILIFRLAGERIVECFLVDQIDEMEDDVEGVFPFVAQ